MITVNSLSGGKTSSFMAVHYPADVNIFALVRIDDPKCSPKDKSIIKKVSDKIHMDFIATAEDDLTLYAMFDLEQMLGKEIIWVTGNSFDKTIDNRKFLPNMMMRYCTTEMKLRPIKNYCKKNFGKIQMNIGFRFDEFERADGFPVEQDWRVVKFPLIEDIISHYRIYKWAVESGIVFPDDSNCVGCFWKAIQQLRKNCDNNPQKMKWFEGKEVRKRRWKKEMTYNDIRTKVGLQQDFLFGTGAGCQAGFCTD